MAPSPQTNTERLNDHLTSPHGIAHVPGPLILPRGLDNREQRASTRGGPLGSGKYYPESAKFQIQGEFLEPNQRLRHIGPTFDLQSVCEMSNSISPWVCAG
jgi:hypothetical protein